MASWRCPHCGAPQPETARCWVCHLSTTSCDTCRHFCKGITIRLGYCGLDADRKPLTGEEQRACWERSPREPAGAASGETDEGSAGGPSLWGVEPAASEDGG